MLIVGISGSSNTNGNSIKLLEKCMETAAELGAETKIFSAGKVLEGLKVPFCTACTPACEGVCGKGKNLEEFLAVMRRADGLLIASPVYFGTLTGQLKALWDKMRCLRREKALLGVVGGALSVGASRYGGQELTVKTIQEMMLVQGMTVVGDGYNDDAGHFGVCAERPSNEDNEAMKRAVILTKRVVTLAKASKELWGKKDVGA